MSPRPAIVNDMQHPLLRISIHKSTNELVVLKRVGEVLAAMGLKAVQYEVFFVANMGGANSRPCVGWGNT